MYYWSGIFLIVSGLASLLFNEFTVQVRRIWPWRRDDSDPLRDAQLNDYYRASVYVGSVISVELGQWLAELSIAHWLIRASIYGICGALLLWRAYREHCCSHIG